MSDNTDFLKRLQSDVFQSLRHAPGLAAVNIIKDDEGTVETQVEKSMQTLKPGETGKRGLALVVLQPRVVKGERNLPGPPLTVEVEVRIVERVKTNRDATNGTIIESQDAAVRVLGFLHHRSFGNRLLYIDKDPLIPVDNVKAGHVSHAVTLRCDHNAAISTRTSPVTDEWGESAGDLVVSGTLTPDATGPIAEAPSLYQGVAAYTTDGADAAPESGRWNRLRWERYAGIVYESYLNGGQVALWTSDSMGVDEMPSGDITTATGWVAGFGATGTPVFSAGGGAVQLSCADDAAAIYYTTDGTYPAPETAQLYTDPITGLEPGDLVRSVAYVDGQNPSNVLETRII
jgi:ribosomal protein L19